MAIIVGCSGWSYDDWIGMFYPLELARKKGEWFAYYANYFKTAEINSSFYSMPNEFAVRSWIKKAKETGGFEYSLKMPQLVTHKSMVQRDLQKSVFVAKTFERTCLKPLAEEGLLGCTLIQLSPYFRNGFRNGSLRDEIDSLSVLEGVLDSLSTWEYDYSVEFRHRSWLDEEKKEIDAPVLDALRQRNVANVIMDSPGFPITKEETANHAYVRFHGRNLDIWYRSGEDKDKDDVKGESGKSDEDKGKRDKCESNRCESNKSENGKVKIVREESYKSERESHKVGNYEIKSDYRLNRYDYLYTSDQLESWVPRIRDAEIKAEKVRVYFNNHARSKAVKNAFKLMDMLHVKHKSKEIRLQNQFTLGSFALGNGQFRREKD